MGLVFLVLLYFIIVLKIIFVFLLVMLVLISQHLLYTITDSQIFGIKLLLSLVLNQIGSNSWTMMVYLMLYFSILPNLLSEIVTLNLIKMEVLRQYRIHKQFYLIFQRKIMEQSIISFQKWPGLKNISK